MSYLIDFAYTFMPENPDSLTEDVAWRASIYTAKQDLICTIRNYGAGNDIEWHDLAHYETMRAESDEHFPDSIDALRDYIDYLLEDYRGTSQEVA